VNRLFVYASLLGQREMDLQCTGARFVEIARLPHRRLAFTKPSRRWGGHCADIVEDPRSEVWGVIYTVTGTDLVALDEREGAPHQYRRLELDVIGANESVRSRAWAYQAVAAVSTHEAAPSATYLATILAGGRERGLPTSYLLALEAAAATLPPSH
jgi:gamma-glutamylcyclotransferase (GGCT)/AIG2-like uncharacterized protein YtfP